MGNAGKLFLNLKVIGFAQINLLENSDTAHKISEGDMLFAVNNNSSEKTISGEIISLRRDGISAEAIELPCDKPVSIGVDFDISANFEKRSIYVVRR